MAVLECLAGPWRFLRVLQWVGVVTRKEGREIRHTHFGLHPRTVGVFPNLTDEIEFLGREVTREAFLQIEWVHGHRMNPLFPTRSFVDVDAGAGFHHARRVSTVTQTMERFDRWLLRCPAQRSDVCIRLEANMLIDRCQEFRLTGRDFLNPGELQPLWEPVQ